MAAERPIIQSISLSMKTLLMRSRIIQALSPVAAATTAINASATPYCLA
jgi:hypothetical protein